MELDESQVEMQYRVSKSREDLETFLSDYLTDNKLEGRPVIVIAAALDTSCGSSEKGNEMVARLGQSYREVYTITKSGGMKRVPGIWVQCQIMRR